MWHIPRMTHCSDILPYMPIKLPLPLFCLVWFSPPLAATVEAKWEGQVKNNMLAWHSYFHYRYGAMNSDMDLALLQSLWFGHNCFCRPAVGGHFVMRCKPHSIWIFKVLRRNQSRLSVIDFLSEKVLPRQFPPQKYIFSLPHSYRECWEAVSPHVWLSVLCESRADISRPVTRYKLALKL